MTPFPLQFLKQCEKKCLHKSRNLRFNTLVFHIVNGYSLENSGNHLSLLLPWEALRRTRSKKKVANISAVNFTLSQDSVVTARSSAAAADFILTENIL